VLDALEPFASQTPGAAMSTVLYGELDPDTGEFRFSSAGHPPPMLESGGKVEILGGGRSPLLSVGWNGSRPEDVVTMPPDATLVLYTDGLVERRGEPFDRGMQRLVRSLRATTDLDPEARSDELLARMLEGVDRDDDVALVCVRRASDADRTFRAWVPAQPAELTVLRRRLGAWLRARGQAEDDVEAVILAVNEAAANGIEHGAQGHGRVELSAELHADEVEISINDQGTWAHRPSVPDRGRGLLLMRALMDEVDIHPGDDGDGGTQVVLRRRMGSGARG
jgi:anti-sigma regulatory factor (Ser/Thr protein kinase)